MRRIFVLLVVCQFLAVGLLQAEPTRPVVLLSDIHLNPFPAACNTVEGKAAMAALLAKPADEWTAEDFHEQHGFPALGEDSNYPLMDSALHEAGERAPDAALVLVAGDFLAHNFHDRFHTCVAAAGIVSSDRSFALFAARTVEYVTLQVMRAFPRAQVVPVLGNNDTDTGDYSLPSGTMLGEIARQWKKTVVRGGSHADFHQFGQYGFYSVKVDGWKHLTVAALNSNVWTAKPGKVSGAFATGAGDAELQWLQGLLLGHIPPGLDSYATRQAKGRIVSMYRECGEGAGQDCHEYAHAVRNLMMRFNGTIAMAVFGHTHQNEFRVVGEGSTAIPLKIVPSISPNVRNNPAFLVAQVAPSFAVADYEAWYLPLSAGKQEWAREFDFDAEYGQSGWNRQSLQAVASMLRKNEKLRSSYFLEMSSGNAEVTVPVKWQGAYLCGQLNLTAETVLPCIAESQLGLPMP